MRRTQHGAPMPEVSVVIPTMNEASSIGAVIDEVRTALVNWDAGTLILDVALRTLYDSGIRDCQAVMWSFRRAILRRLHLIHDGMAFSEELKLEVLRGGFRYLEILIEYRVRVGEKKIRSLSDATGNLLWLARKRVGWVPRGP